MTITSNKPLIALSLLLTAACGASQAQNTTLVLTYQGDTGPTNCQFISPTGVVADANGHLLVTGAFGATGCPSASTVIPSPVIVPNPSNWALPATMTAGQTATVQWAAVNATSCTYNGSAPAGGALASWPVGGTACSGTACETLKTIVLAPAQVGTYSFGLTCTGTGGTVVSPLRTTTVSSLPANPAVITSGPANWPVSSWVVGQANQFSWAASNAASCSFSGTFPGGVALGDFMTGAGGTTCSGTAACATVHPITLTPSVAGSYTLTMTCLNADNAPVSSSNAWTVTANSGASCVAPTGFTRMTTGRAYYQGTGTYTNVDLTQWQEIYGRGAVGSTTTVAWPGVSTVLAGPGIDQNAYVAAKFRTTAAGNIKSANLFVDHTSYSGMGGTQPPKAKMSMTVSTKCGDFSTTTTSQGGFIPPGCFASDLAGGDSFITTTDQSLSGACRLQPNTDYYLNMIYAPLPNPTPTSATSNQCLSYPCRVLQVHNGF